MAMRAPGGRWSLTQVYQEAGITLAVARTVIKHGLLDPDALTQDDVVLLRVAAALLDAPRPYGTTRVDAVHRVRGRDRTAMAMVRDAITDPAVNNQVNLLVWPDGAAITRTSIQMVAALEEHTNAGNPCVVLPIGAWVTDLREQIGGAA